MKAAMDKIKRNERLAVMTQILTASPNRIFTLSYFCDLFSTAKSSVSEDIAILGETMQRFRLGRVETVTGAAGGVRYRPIGLGSSSRDFVQGLCDRLMEPERQLPGGYLYFSDILAEPEAVQGMGTLIAGQYYDAGADFVLTMETKGIPVALMTASALRVPLIIARRPAGADRGRFHAGRRHRPGHGGAYEGIQRVRGGHLLRAGPGKPAAPADRRRKGADAPVRYPAGRAPSRAPRRLDPLTRFSRRAAPFSHEGRNA